MRDQERESVVELEKITLQFGSRVIFDELSLTVPKGKITAVMGPSGTGKTTLLKVMSGQLPLKSGSVTLMGERLNKISTKELYQLRTKMGVLFQSGALFTDMTVFENIAFPLREHTDLDESIIRTLVLLKLEAVGLRALESYYPSQLSGGQARRVALARAIALDPELLLYDEPFAGQDPISKGVLVNLIKRFNNALGLTSIIVSHDVQEVLSMADYVCLLSGGKIVATGTPQEINESDDEWVRQFIDGLSNGPVPFHQPTVSLKEALF